MVVIQDGLKWSGQPLFRMDDQKAVLAMVWPWALFHFGALWQAASKHVTGRPHNLQIQIKYTYRELVGSLKLYLLQFKHNLLFLTLHFACINLVIQILCCLSFHVFFLPRRKMRKYNICASITNTHGKTTVNFCLFVYKYFTKQYSN